MQFKSISRLLPATILLVLGGCAVNQPHSHSHDSEVAAERAVAQSVVGEDVRVDTENAEIAQFWQAAEQARQENNDAVALQLLYEALEIDPQSSILWSRAAEIQLDNDQPAQAENFAIRSNTFAEDNVALLHRNWLIIEHARQLRGDLLGVRSARRKLQEYQYQ